MNQVGKDVARFTTRDTKSCALVFVAGWEILLQKVDGASTFWRNISQETTNIYVFLQKILKLQPGTDIIYVFL